MDDDAAFSVDVQAQADARTFAFAGPLPLVERIEHAGQQDYLDLFARLSPVLGTRMPRNRTPIFAPPATMRHRPLLTESLSPDIRHGYGDPSVLWVAEERAWYMVATSNDAPNAFPILRTVDLADWTHVGFVFPEGRTPAWGRTGAGVADFWAPELHRVGDAFLVCYAAREADRSLSIGIATAARPGGPFASPSEPLLRGGVIDAHIFVPSDGAPILFWKEDRNGVWPRLLVRMIAADPSLADSLFTERQDQRSARLVAALWAWGERAERMEQFFMLQPLIEAAIQDFAHLRHALAVLGTPDALRALEATHTPIFAQSLSPDGLALLGERRFVLGNDLAWEGHLIEGPWLTEQDGRFYLFYAGNDFSTDAYGIGVAVADDPWGPYRKMERPLLRSDAEWTGPGHPSVARGPDGAPHLFYHAFFPGHAGYGEFRALLTTPLRFRPDAVDVG